MLVGYITETRGRCGCACGAPSAKLRAARPRARLWLSIRITEVCLWRALGPRPRCTAHGRARSYGFLLAGHRAPPVVLRAAGTARGEVARGDGARKQAQTARGETARTARGDGADGRRRRCKEMARGDGADGGARRRRGRLAEMAHPETARGETARRDGARRRGADGARIDRADGVRGDGADGAQKRGAKTARTARRDGADGSTKPGVHLIVRAMIVTIAVALLASTTDPEVSHFERGFFPFGTYEARFLAASAALRISSLVTGGIVSTAAQSSTLHRGHRGPASSAGLGDHEPHLVPLRGCLLPLWRRRTRGAHSPCHTTPPRPPSGW